MVKTVNAPKKSTKKKVQKKRIETVPHMTYQTTWRTLGTPSDKQ